MKKLLQKTFFLSVLMVTGAATVFGHEGNTASTIEKTSVSDEWMIVKTEANLIFSVLETRIGDERFVFVKIENQSATARLVSFEITNAKNGGAVQYLNQAIGANGIMLLEDPTFALKLTNGQSLSSCSITLL